MERAKLLADMSMIPVNETALVLDDKLLIMDNLAADNHDVPLDEVINRFPMRLSTTCLLIVVKGTVGFSVNFRDFEATDDSCVFISEGTIIENVSFDPDARVILLSFSSQNFSVLENSHQRNVHRLYALQVVLFKLKGKHLDMLKSTYQMLRTILSDGAFEANRNATAASCLNFMNSIIEHGVSSDLQIETRVSRKDEIVSRFLECVNRNYREHRELNFYADQLCLSLKYLSHVVYEQTGRHPSQWIKDYVILDAKTMLRSGHYTVQQISDELHFANQSFFGKYFKDAVGVSPKKWK